MRKIVIILCTLAFVVSGCGQTPKKQTANNVMEIHEANDISEDLTILQDNYKYSNLFEVDLKNTPQILRNFPLSWELFGVENGDTVTYKLCYASNPEFTLSRDYKIIHIAIGNEVDGRFEIAQIFYNDSIFRFKLKPNNTGFSEYFTFRWIDKNKMIGTIFDDDRLFLPKERLANKRVIESDCDETDD